MPATAPRWFPDPTGRHEYRYWDGSTWTSHVSDAGVVSVDPQAVITTPATSTVAVPAAVAAADTSKAAPAPSLPTETPAAAPQARGFWRRVPAWAWVLIGLVAFIALFLLSPIVGALGLVVLVTAVVSLAKRKPTWLRFPSRKAARVAVAVSGAVVLVSGMLTSAIYPSIAANQSSDVKALPTSSAAPSTHAPTTATPTYTAAPSATPTRPAVTPTNPAAPAHAGTALAVLQTLPVKGRAPRTGYTRAQFGPAWEDVDHNGCDTRNDILNRDLTGITRSGSCKVLSGTLKDPYTATVIHFVRGVQTSTAVQIDHVVALSNAWQTGAQQLSAARREQLANDPLNLLAVDGPTNEAKGDGDAATWLPPNKAFRCQYVARQVSVKAAYKLWVTPAEKGAIARVLASCPNQPALTPTAAQSRPYVAVPAPAKPAPAKPAPAPAKPAPPKSSNVYYANCAAVRAAGAAPLHIGSPGYRPALDRDHDGVACE